MRPKRSLITSKFVRCERKRNRERERSINFINNITLDYKQQQRVVDVVSKTNVFIDDK